MISEPSHDEEKPGVGRKRGRKASGDDSSASRDKDRKVVRVKSEPITGIEDGERTDYWIGTFPECPVQNVTVGGVCFPRFSGVPAFDKNAKPDRPLEYGAEVKLTEAQVKLIEKGVTMRVVRSTGGENSRKRGMILMRDGPGMRPRPGDVPLGRYLYMAEGHRGRGFPLAMEE